MVHVSAAASLGIVLLASPVLADDPIRPDPRLTPGAVLTTDTAAVCAPGYSRTVRHTSGQLKAFVYREYGINRRQGHYEVDQLARINAKDLSKPAQHGDARRNSGAFTRALKQSARRLGHLRIAKPLLGRPPQPRWVAESRSQRAPFVSPPKEIFGVWHGGRRSEV
jgi:hypothetical protein